MLKHRAYMDYASLTPIDRRVLREMKKYSSAKYANASSWHKEGVAAKNALDEGRRGVASFIHAHPDEIVFTSGGTESNDLALSGSVKYLNDAGMKYEGMHVIVSEIEHSSVIGTARYLKKMGISVDFVEVDRSGVVVIEDLKSKIKSNTVIVSIMSVNNETGVIQSVEEIAKIVRREKINNNARYPLFHSDAASSGLKELNMEKLSIDLLTLDSSKVYGPRGTGALYVRRGTPIGPINHGGAQEKRMRSGTENIPSIMGFAEALRFAGLKRAEEYSKLEKLRKYFVEKLKSIRPDIAVNGEGAEISPHILNVSIPGIDNEFFLFQLDAEGVACSTKSSCLRDEDESYVLKAMNVESKNSVRFSFGRWTKKSHVDKVLSIFEKLT